MYLYDAHMVDSQIPLMLGHQRNLRHLDGTKFEININIQTFDFSHF